MTKMTLFATMLVLGSTGVVRAGGQAGSFGLGAEYELNGIGGASANYDAGNFHVGGFLGYDRASVGGTTESLFDIGARFFFHVHKTAMSDFGIGGGIGIESLPPTMGNRNRTTNIFLEPSFQIRLFVAANVALSFTAGIIIGTADADEFAITGQAVGSSLTGLPGNVGLTGGAGVHYYFF